MRRLLLLILLIGSLTIAWLAGSEAGLHSTLRLAVSASGGQLQVDGVRGRLAGPLDIAQLRWQSPGMQVDISQLHLDWSPSALLQGELEIATLSADTIKINRPADPSPTHPPADLSLPLTVDAKNLSILKFIWNDSLQLETLAARFESARGQHRLSRVTMRWQSIALQGDASLAAGAPFDLQATATLTGQIDAHPLALTLAARGPLAEIQAEALATGGLAGRLDAVLTPFAPAAFRSARIGIEGIDPAAWWPDAPSARISLAADLVPSGNGIAGSLGLTNHDAGPLDRQRLPLQTLAAALRWQGDTLHLDTLHGTLPGGATLTGTGRWQAGDLTLDLAARDLNATRLLAALRPTRLNGPIRATLGEARQQFALDLRDQQFTLRADAALADGRLTVSQARLAAGDAELAVHGELSLAAPRAFKAEGHLRAFDPSRFARVPSARLNAAIHTSGRLLPRPQFDADFLLTDSRLAGEALLCQGKLTVDWPLIPQAVVDLQAGANRLTARGAFGKPGDRIDLQIDAPLLKPYGIEGELSGHATLSGSGEQARFSATLDAPHLARTGFGRLTALHLTAELGLTPEAPLNVRLAIGALGTPTTPDLVRQLQWQSNGQLRDHRWNGQATLPGKRQLELKARGSLATDKPRWQGQFLEAHLNAPDARQSIHLTNPAPLAAGVDGWAFGPADFTGDSLDWHALLQASGDARQLSAQLAANGSRLGTLRADWLAAAHSPWAIAPDQRWSGQLTAESGNLAWLGDLLGDGWRSEGRLDGELTLAGTPARPLLSGRVHGKGLALRWPAQGLTLTNGQLDADLHDNVLRLRQLAFDSPLTPPPRALQLEARDDLATLTRGPGRLLISGETRLAGPGDAESAMLDFKLERLGLFQSPEQWVALSGSGRLSWQSATLGASARLAVDAGFWQLAPGGTPRLSDDVIVRRAASAEPAPTLRPLLDLDITTDLGRNFVFQGAGLASRLTGEVRIAAKGRDLPRATGSIRTRGGRYRAYGQQLDIERGILNFNGLLDNPGLDVRAIRKGLAVEAGVQIGGTAKKPVVRLVSDPELPEAEKLAWLVLGHGPEQMGAGDAALLVSAAGGLLGNDAGQLLQQLKQTFGLDEFGIRQGSLGESSGRTPTSRIAGRSGDLSGNTGDQIFSVGRRLSSNALLSYEQTLGRAESIVKLTVNLNRQIALVGRAGSDNALDIFYTLTFGRADEQAVGK